MREKDLAEVRQTAIKIATLHAATQRWAPLADLRTRVTDTAALRRWLLAAAIHWAALPDDHPARTGHPGPLVTEHAYALLLAPGRHSTAWLYRELLLVGVLEELNRRGWHLDREAAAEAVRQMDATLDAEDARYQDDIPA
jgi:hypothetical protein